MHPYYPLALRLPGYAAPVIPFQQVLTYFFAACGILFVATWVLTGEPSIYLLSCTKVCSNDLSTRTSGAYKIGSSYQEVFFIVAGLIAGCYKRLRFDERVTASWFAMTGMVHLIIEGQPSARNACACDDERRDDL
jgi:cytochrome bd-type quinol oxidase subunit 2